MRKLIVDIYRIIYRITGNKAVSLLSALTYISVLNLVVIYGLSILLQGLLHETRLIVKLFSFPYNLILAIMVMVLINFCMMLPLYKLSKDAKRRAHVVPLLVYTFASLLLILYSHFFNNMF